MSTCKTIQTRLVDPWAQAHPLAAQAEPITQGFVVLARDRNCEWKSPLYVARAQLSPVATLPTLPTGGCTLAMAAVKADVFGMITPS